MREVIKNFEPPILRVELNTDDVASHAIMTKYPAIWQLLVQKLQQEVRLVAAEVAKLEGMGPKAIERRDAREQEALRNASIN